MSTTPSTLFGRGTTAGERTPGPRRHFFLKILLGIAVFVAIVVAGLVVYTSTPGFANFVRGKLIAVL